ncbi:MAG: hypothetical protein ACTHMS_23475 [Jatrophihabitans sp.]|uniref:hypothetical protein n=1 Tax=Jatrophihabitans sp. TaxID=1932789 RepID=UPI003F81962D
MKTLADVAAAFEDLTAAGKSANEAMAALAKTIRESIPAIGACRRCGSPFLRALTAPGVVLCRTCKYIHLGFRPADDCPTDGPVLVVSPPQADGSVVVQRVLPDRVLCSSVAAPRERVVEVPRKVINVPPTMPRTWV